MPFSNLAYASERREDRDEVHHRTCAYDSNHRPYHLVIVNISSNGLMARCESPIEPDARLSVRLPDLIPLQADVRWSLGGRIGCEFERAIDPAVCYALLPKLR